MSRREWTPDFVQYRFPAEVRKQRRVNGENPDQKPTHQWLRVHGYTGIQNYAARHNKTVDEVLLEECGFESRERKSLPGRHRETKQLVRQWLNDEDETFSRLNDVSLNNAWTHIRRLMEISQDELGTSNLLRPARAPPGKSIRLTLNLFRGLNDQLTSEGARYNYASTLEKFYDYAEMIGEVNSNPAKKLLPRMGWTYERVPPEEVLKPLQVKAVWAATTTLEEKILILTLAGAGARTGDLQIIVALEDVQLDRRDPCICFDDRRKNGAGTVPIMAGIDYYKRYIEDLKEEGKEMLFPSDQSRDGTRSDTWVRTQVEELVDRAGVRLPDGSKPTPKHFRQFWYNEYLEAYSSYLARVEKVATDQGSASATIVDDHYLSNHHARDHFREFAQTHFETAFPSDVVLSPEEIAEARFADESEDDQMSLDEFIST